ncbi:MAG: HAD family phosphatase [Pseudomonadota bacterium]
MAIEAVIFDIGNVLIEWQPEVFYDREIGEVRRRALFSEVDLHHMNELIDRGEDFRETVYQTAEDYPAWQTEIEAWHDRWLELAGPSIDRSVRLLRALRSKGVPVHALSNIGEATLALATTRHPFLAEFDQSFVSGQLRVTKPDPAIYEIVEERLETAASSLLFADDRAENIETARNRGWQTHLFTGPDGFAERLVEEGLLSAAEAA